MNATAFKLPKIVDKSNGQPRCVGIEIEMSGLDLAMIACQINIAYGGRIKEISPYEFTVEKTVLGDMKVELDSRYLKKIEQKNFSDKEDSLKQFSYLKFYTSDIMAALSKNIVPCELVCPPLPIGRLSELNAIVQSLREHGAKGTRYSIFYAFGVHLNPEIPDLSTSTLLNYFKAFLCLQEWLINREKVDYTRKLSPFINEFPKNYIDLVLQPDYRPKRDQLIDDYLAYNPTRNRLMDMLPILAFLDEERVKRSLEPGVKLNKRPTLHYRLPNSDIDNPDWGLWHCWNNWLPIEDLANNEAQLAAMCEAYINNCTTASMGKLIPWVDKVKEFLSDL